LLVIVKIQLLLFRGEGVFFQGRRGWLFPHSRRIIGNKVERSFEAPKENEMKI